MHDNMSEQVIIIELNQKKFCEMIIQLRKKKFHASKSQTVLNKSYPPKIGEIWLHNFIFIIIYLNHSYGFVYYFMLKFVCGMGM